VAKKDDVKIQSKPNILVIFGDDIGQSNVSAYSKGVMGYRTPNIDRIANEGMIFTDCYGELLHGWSCSFHTGSERVPFRIEQGGLTWCCDWNASGRPYNRGTPQTARLRDGAIRQKSLWRQG
jgi:hypothetical protein